MLISLPCFISHLTTVSGVDSRPAKICFWVWQVFFLMVFPFSPYQLIDPSHELIYFERDIKLNKQNQMCLKLPTFTILFSSFQIRHIGLPTNVSHLGHAKSPEEAAELIEKLFSEDQNALKGTLPAPLKPGGKKNKLAVLVVKLYRIVCAHFSQKIIIDNKKNQHTRFML